MPSRFYYPLDLVGNSPTNLATNEAYTPDMNSVLVLEHGAFYSDTLRIVEVATSLELAPGTDFVAIVPETDAQEMSGLSVHTAVLFKRPVGNILVTTQYVGGIFEYLHNSVIEAIRNASADNRPIRFSDILNRPALWPGAAHMTQLGDLTGYGQLIAIGTQIHDAVINGARDSLHDLCESLINSAADIRFQRINERLQELEVKVQRLTEAQNA